MTITNTTSAELLTHAASKLREYAEAAIPGPWVKDGGEIYNTAPGGLWVGETLHSGDAATTEANSAYITIMHPPVALFLAAAMDEVAKAVRFGSDMEARLGYSELIVCAREVLREVKA